MNYRRNFCLLILWFTGTCAGLSATHSPTLEDLRKEGILESSLRNRSNLPAKTLNPKVNMEQFESEIQPILKAHCIPCHGPDKSKARLRIDELNPNLVKGNDADWWLEVQSVISNGEMPPDDEPEMPGLDRGKVMEWLSGEIRTASITRRATGGYSSFRRMTKYEYNYALQDLLGLPWNFARDLPPEAHSEDGFKNSSENLHMSVTQLETYRRVAKKALSRATVRGPKPSVIYWGGTMDEVGKVDWQKQAAKVEKTRQELEGKPEAQEQKFEQLLRDFKKTHRRPYFKNLENGHTVPQSWGYGGARHALTPTDIPPVMPKSADHVAIIPQGTRQKLVIELGEKIPDEGILRVRVRASNNSMAEENIPTMQLEFGWQASNEGRALMRVSDQDVEIHATPENPHFYQWDVILGDIYPRNSVRKTSRMGSTPSPSEHLRLVNNSVNAGEIQIDYVEISGPIHDQWPPESHRRIFFESSQSSNENAYAREILVTFMPKAWRRSIVDEEVNQKLVLFQTMRNDCETFEEAMIEVLATVLSSPNFLYLSRDYADIDSEENPPKSSLLSQHELASRLSMFLWCSLPDDRLRNMASLGQLSNESTLRNEVSRMLEDPRSERFSQEFVHQWLDMQLLDFLGTDNKLDTSLKEAMKMETILFFQEVLRHDESLLNFLHSDFTMANERLAKHYNLSNIKGSEFRRVQLNMASRRGGMLTHAGLLAMNSSGNDSNPLKRGIWMLESFLNDPPPPPPPAVPEIDLADPAIARMTLKERIEDHRNHAACMSCHIKIDPWGIAFENYDSRGLWRAEANGKPVDSTSRLYNNDSLAGMLGLKRFLLKNRQDQFVLALTHKLCVFALGRPLTFSDRSLLEEIASSVRQKDDGLRDLIMEIATSKLFLSK